MTGGFVWISFPFLFFLFFPLLIRLKKGYVFLHGIMSSLVLFFYSLFYSLLSKFLLLLRNDHLRVFALYINQAQVLVFATEFSATLSTKGGYHYRGE